MTRTNNPLRACIAAALIIAGSGNAFSAAPGVPPRTPEGRFGTPCYVTSVGEQCMVSFSRLLAMPEKYDGRFIMIAGYLTMEFEIPVLYPSRESYDANLIYEGVELLDDLPRDVMARLKKGPVSPVSVIGKFDAKHIGSFGYLGALRSIRGVTDARWPGRLPRPQRVQ